MHYIQLFAGWRSVSLQSACASQRNVFADEALRQMKLGCIDERVVLHKIYANDRLTYIEYTFIYTESHLVPFFLQFAKMCFKSEKPDLLIPNQAIN